MLIINVKDNKHNGWKRNAKTKQKTKKQQKNKKQNKTKKTIE